MTSHHRSWSHRPRPRAELPVWEPLLAAVGEALAGDFMWMYETDLEDGAVVHAYKHTQTRRYLFLDENLNAFSYTPISVYSPLRLDEAIVAALCPWCILAGYTPEIGQAISAAVLRAAELVHPAET